MQKCDFASIRAVVKKAPRIALLYTGAGCSACPPYVKTVKEELRGLRVKRIEIGNGEDACEAAADRLNIDATPTLLYFEKGRLRRMLQPTGDPETDRRALAEIRGR